MSKLEKNKDTGYNLFKFENHKFSHDKKKIRILDEYLKSKNVSALKLKIYTYFRTLMQYHREKEINPKLDPSDPTSYLDGLGELAEGG